MCYICFAAVVEVFYEENKEMKDFNTRIRAAKKIVDLKDRISYVDTILRDISKECNLPAALYIKEDFIPNKETEAVMEAARNGDMVKVGSPEELIEELKKDD